MFREMRRKRQLLSREDSVRILQEGTSGVLALLGDEEYPYAVPLSYVYQEDKIYFHCARSGHKLDAVKRHAKASFCVVGQDQVVPEKYTTYFLSVVAFGKVRILEKGPEAEAAIELLAGKYHPDDTEEGRRSVIDREGKNMCLLSLDIEHMTGKKAVELLGH